MTAVYSCPKCDLRFTDARERDLHAELDHGYVAPTHAELVAKRTAAMEAQGFRIGDRVRVAVDAHPLLPAHVRYSAGDFGIVGLNLMHGPERISVRFRGSDTPHAIDPAHLEVVPDVLWCGSFAEHAPHASGITWCPGCDADGNVPDVAVGP